MLDLSKNTNLFQGDCLEFMNKVTSKSLDYAAKVHYNKYIRLKHARDKYMKNRSSRNFDEVKKLSEDFDKVTCQS